MADDQPRIDPENLKTVADLLKPKPWRDAFALAQIPGMIQQQKALERAGKRAEAQVDAMLRAKYKDCGMEGNYQPPEEDEMGNDTYINCPVIGLEAVQAIEGKRGKRGPWWKWLVGSLAAVLLGGLLVYFTARYFDNDDRYEITAVPNFPELET